MVFTREGIIYNKANPALYGANGVETPHSVSLSRERLRRNANGKLATPPNSWVCRIGEEYHILPRGKKTASSSVADSFKMTNTEVLKLGDPLSLLEPHTTLSTAGLNGGDTVTLSIESMGDTYSIDGASGVPNQDQVVEFINNSSILSSKVYALSGASASDVVHIFAKGMNMYIISGTGVTVADAMLVAARPIGTISLLQSKNVDSDYTYNLVTVTPNGAAEAIAANDIPVGASINAPVYNQVVGLFNDVIDFERTTQVLVAPVVGAVAMNAVFLSQFDETLREQFPKITFVNE